MTLWAYISSYSLTWQLKTGNRKCCPFGFEARKPLQTRKQFEIVNKHQLRNHDRKPIRLRDSLIWSRDRSLRYCRSRRLRRWWKLFEIDPTISSRHISESVRDNATKLDSGIPCVTFYLSADVNVDASTTYFWQRFYGFSRPFDRE